jgi:D-3-phosphoglycerate dehydrogenase
MRHVAHDPYADAKVAEAAGVALIDLETLLRESDFVIVAAALTPETRHIINAERLALMKPTAFLISTARGPLVDQTALYEALRDKRIAAAALDVFEQEPVDPHDPILKLENVIVTPHALCWTDECERIMGESVLRSIQAVAAGKTPTNVVNPEAAEHPALQAKLKRRTTQTGILQS